MSSYAWLITSDSSRRVPIPSDIVIPAETEAYIRVAFLFAQQRANTEISGMCRVEERESVFYIKDPLIPTQLNTGDGTDFLGSVWASMLDDIREKGQDPLEWYCWWHSHVRSQAYFSFVDQRMIRSRLQVLIMSEYAATYPQKAPLVLAGPFISLVGNVFGDLAGRIDFLQRADDRDSQITCEPSLCRPFSQLSLEEQEQLLYTHADAVRERISDDVFFRHRS